MTVDELNQYRRKRVSHTNKQLDNLHVEEGSLKSMKTEYERRFKAPLFDEFLTAGTNSLKAKDMEENNDAIAQNPLTELKTFSHKKTRQRRPGSHLKLEALPMDFTTEKVEKFIVFPNAERARSLRRNTALKPEGEFYTETEFQREFQPHGSFERTRSLKHPSNLKLEGLFDTLTSEQREKYVAYLISRRPVLEKRHTELKLVGEFDFNTESQMKFVAPGSQPRHALRKRSTSLKLDGEADYTPEYRRSFVDLPRSRPLVMRPHGQLCSEGELDLGTEFRSKFIEFPVSRVPVSAKLENNIHLEGDLSLNPEYKEQFKYHGRSKSEIIRRRDNLNLEGEFSYETEKDKYTPNFGTSKMSSQEHLPSNHFSDSEYHSQYVDFPRKRPQIRKPLANMVQDKSPLETTSEKSFQYKSHGTVARTSSLRPPGSLQLEGGTMGEAEYKNQYVEFPVSYKKSPKPKDSMPREFSSFKVIDYKAEPLMAATPDHSSEQPSFRLEVHNVDGKQRGFHPSPDRIYPAEAVVSRSLAQSAHHEAALQAAIKRREALEKNLSNRPQSKSKRLSKSDINANEPAFTVLDNRPDTAKSDPNQTWSFPNVSDNNFTSPVIM